MSIVVKDKEGAIKVDSMRNFFEQSVTQTEVLKKNFPLGRDDLSGAYLNYKTDLLWSGYALGMRCHERLINHGMI